MSLWAALLLGLLQGLTEFLPVSSSGHLALAQLLLPGFEQPGVVFDAMLHAGTALAIVWYERRQLLAWLTQAAGRRLLGLLVLGTLVTAVLALPLRRVVHGAFERPVWVGMCLLVTGVVVLLSRRLGGDRSEGDTGWRHAVLIGLAQGVAVFPGISRSGITITAGLACGLERAWAARFSFLLSVPAVAGATIVEVLGERQQLVAAAPSFWLACLAGGTVAGISGYLALRMVLHTLSQRLFHRFGWYCLPLGLLVLAATWGGWL